MCVSPPPNKRTRPGRVMPFRNCLYCRMRHQGLCDAGWQLQSLDIDDDEAIDNCAVYCWSGFQIQSTESTVPLADADTSADMSQVTTGYIDETVGMKVEYEQHTDPNTYADLQVSADIANFLSRPQLIKTVTWLETDNPGQGAWSCNPWKDFFNSTTTRKKLDNYAFVNCVLKVKIVINASPFYYGSQLVYYSPLAGFYATNTGLSNNSSKVIINNSQMPHIWLYPQRSQGGELTLPFFFHKNWLPLTNSDTTAMGLLSGVVVNQLTSANSATGTGATIQVWAWAEDVKLNGPTTVLAIQSDEYVEGKGVISKPASNVAKVARALSSAPIIGPFARATDIGASAVSKIASLFGFSNPPVIEPVGSFMPKPFGHFASPSISTTIEKLTIDPKQELTVDPRIAGISGVDEMLISNIITRESYLTSFSMSTARVADDLLFSTLIGPNYFDFDNATTPGINVIYPTPLDHVARMFQYWRGDIILRFRVIATPYHKGRFRISYDPVSNITGSATDYTSVFNQVVDIGSETDVEIRVPYMQAFGWLQTRTATNAAIWSLVGSLPTINTAFDNGCLTARVVTQLSAPIAVSDIVVQVFVRAAENFEFGAPRNLPQGTFMTVQSQDYIEYGDSCKVLIGSSPGGDEDTKLLVNMGEKITSIRQLMRRTNLSYSTQVPSNTADVMTINEQWQTIYPPYYGYQSNGRASAKGTLAPLSNFSFNFCTVTPYHWMARCYVGQRGSMYWQYNVDTNGTDGPLASIRAYRNGSTIPGGGYNLNSNSGAVLTDSAFQKFNLIDSGSGGQSLTNQITNTSINVCYPNYNIGRFHFTDPVNGALGMGGDLSNVQTAVLQMKLKPLAATKPIANIRTDKYFSIGPDFSLLFFLCAPVWVPLSIPVAN